MSRSLRSRFSFSNLLVLAMIVAAGAIAWHGLSNAAPEAAAQPAQPVTIAGDAPSPEEVLALGRSVQGHLPTRIVVPSAGIDAPIAEVGVVVRDGNPVWETAWHAAGHHLNSARPGQPGNMVLTGHVSVADRSNLPVFATLDDVRPGDTVEIYAGETVYQYQVTEVRVVEPNATKLLKSDHRSLTTLITCTPDLKHRLVVSATLVS